MSQTDEEVDDLPGVVLEVFKDLTISQQQKDYSVETVMPILYDRHTIGKKEMEFWVYLFSDRVHPSFYHMRWEWQAYDQDGHYYCAILRPRPRSQGFLRVFQSIRENGRFYEVDIFSRRGSSKYLFYLMLKMAKCYCASFVVHSNSRQLLCIHNHKL